MIVRIVRIVRIVQVVSKKMFRRSGRSYGNAIQTIANDPDDWDDLDRLDRIEFYPDDQDDRVNFESPGPLAIVWVAFPYRLNTFFETTGTIRTIRTIRTIIWKQDLISFSQHKNYITVKFAMGCILLNEKPVARMKTGQFWNESGWILRTRDPCCYQVLHKNFHCKRIELTVKLASGGIQ